MKESKYREKEAVLITSDIHGDKEGIKLLEKITSIFNIKMILSSGDQCPSPYTPFYSSLVSVRGNSDSSYYYIDSPLPPLYREITIFNRRIIMTHGHAMKSSDFKLKKGDIFIEGHTHTPHLFEKNGIYFLNPGSPSRPRSSEGPTAALLFESFLTLLRLIDFSFFSSKSI